MKATPLLRDRIELGGGVRAELVLWRVPVPVRGSAHTYKYRLALIDNDACVLRYDNEAGKGDHKHIGGEESQYPFSTIRQLRENFLADVALYMRGRYR